MKLIYMLGDDIRTVCVVGDNVDPIPEIQRDIDENWCVEVTRIFEADDAPGTYLVVTEDGNIDEDVFIVEDIRVVE